MRNRPTQTHVFYICHYRYIGAIAALAVWCCLPAAVRAAGPQQSDSGAPPPKPCDDDGQVQKKAGTDNKKTDVTQNPGSRKTGKPAEKSAAPDQKAEPGAKPLPAISPVARYDYQGEATGILQHLFKFRSPYEGPNSLASRDETEITDTYTLYLGARLMPNLEVYVNPELAAGNGFSAGNGLGGFTNGDLIGQPSLTKDLYIARAFVRWRVPMPHLGPHAGGEEANQEQTGRSPNFIAGTIPAHRLVIQTGKMAVNDVFDYNAYAGSPRTQFMNNAFGNNLAYDFAEDTRGYDYGLSVSWINPDWALRVGTFAMPATAGGPNLSGGLSDNRGDQIEIDRNVGLLRSSTPPLTLRLLAYRNVANMGSYRDALAAAHATGRPPDITTVRQRGAAKYGFGLNFEQPLADGGNTGLFGRWGWNDGATESYAFAECDRFLSLGGQLAGTSWGRKDDRVGLAFALNGLSNAHRDYLTAGGIGFVLGDGKLNYGDEGIIELYYSYQFSRPLALTMDLQYINNPGYNRDRGPVTVLSARAHYAF